MAISLYVHSNQLLVCNYVINVGFLTFIFADVAEKVLDRCTEKEHIYEFLEDFKPMSWHCFQRSEHNDIERGFQNPNGHWGPKKFDRSNHPLAIMVSCNVHIGEVLSTTSFTVYLCNCCILLQTDFYFFVPPYTNFLQVTH